MLVHFFAAALCVLAFLQVGHSMQHDGTDKAPRRTLKKRGGPFPNGIRVVGNDDKNPALAAGARRSRRKVKCRDSDVIIVTYPKSGTHWLASVLSQIFFAPYGGHPAAPGLHTLPDISVEQRFHRFPIFWTLPGTAEDDAGGVSDWNFEAIESVPENMPRIFLSHMPTKYFEYEPSLGTRILYLMREPHAVLQSTINMMSRRVALGERYLEGATASDLEKVDTTQQVFTKMDLAEIADDFMRGGLRFPPRFVDSGSEFGWNSHVMKWWKRISSRDPRYGHGAVVSYDQAMLHPEKAIEDIMLFLNAFSLFNSSTIAERAKYSSVKRAMSATSVRQQIFESEQHMPAKAEESHATSNWLPFFEDSFSVRQQAAFNKSTFAYRMIGKHKHPDSPLIRF